MGRNNFCALAGGECRSRHICFETEISQRRLDRGNLIGRGAPESAKPVARASLIAHDGAMSKLEDAMCRVLLTVVEHYALNLSAKDDQ